MAFHKRFGGLICVLATALVPITLQVAVPSDPGLYCLACVEPAEGESGLKSPSPNLGNKLRLFFLDVSGGLVASATFAAQSEGQPLGVSSILRNGVLLARGDDLLYLNRSLGRLTIGGLLAASQPGGTLLREGWDPVLTKVSSEEEVIKASLAQAGLLKDWGTGWIYTETIGTGKGAHAVSPKGDAVWMMISLQDEQARGPLGSPLLYDALMIRRLGETTTVALVLDPKERWRVSSPSWSPDGRFLAFSRVSAQVHQEVDERLKFDVRVADGWELAIYDTSTGQIKTYGPKSCTIYPGLAAPWSPDGSRILIQTSYDDPSSPTRRAWTGIFLVDLKTGKYERLSGPQAREWLHSWAPTGDGYLFSARPLVFAPPPRGQSNPMFYGVGLISGPLRWMVIDATGRDVRGEIAWSPDGKYLAYASAEKEQGEWLDRIMVIESWGGGVAREIVRSGPNPQRLSRRYHNLVWLDLSPP